MGPPAIFVTKISTVRPKELAQLILTGVTSVYA